VSMQDPSGKDCSVVAMDAAAETSVPLIANDGRFLSQTLTVSPVAEWAISFTVPPRPSHNF